MIYIMIISAKCFNVAILEDIMNGFKESWSVVGPIRGDYILAISNMTTEISDALAFAGWEDLETIIGGSE